MSSFLRTTCTALSLVFATAALARAQTSVEWLAIHNGAAGQTDDGTKCAVDASGNVYVCGHSNTSTMPASADFETVKYSPAGVELWTRHLDSGGEDVATDIAVDAAGDVYVTGSTVTSQSVRLALIKYQSDGTLAWSRYFGPSIARGYQLALDAAQNPIVAGFVVDPITLNDLLVLSYSPQGQLLWSTHVDGAGHAGDFGYAVAVAPSGDIYAAGELTNAAGLGDLALVKLNASGVLQWKRTVDGGAHSRDSAQAIAISGNDRIVIAGWSEEPGAAQDVAVVQFDAAGNATPLRGYDGPVHGTDRAFAAAIDASGVLWVLASSQSITNADFVMLRYDAAGQLLTSTRYDGPAHRWDQPTDLVLGTAGGASACGYSFGASGTITDTDIVLVQYDADGNQILANIFSTAGIFKDQAFDVDLAPNGRLAIAGSTTGGASGGTDYLALQLDMNALPQGYCAAKVNSLGCTPIIDFTGLSSASAANGFVVRASNMRNRENGMLLCGVSGAASIPFQGGTLCVHGPIRRSPAVNSHGTPLPASDCSGVYSLDMNAFATGALGGTPLPALLVPGTQVYCQWRGRDPGFAAPNNTTLSSAISYRVLP